MVLFLSLLLCISLLFGNAIAKADYIGTVTSTRASVRELPDTNAKRYCYIQNGDEVSVLGEHGDWYIVDLQTLNLSEQPEQAYGYVLKKYLSFTLSQITLTNTVTLWADPWGSGIANGEKVKGTVLTVLSETDQYFCVQTNDGKAGSSFLKKSDIYCQQDSFFPTSSTSTYITPTSTQAVVTATSLKVRRNAIEDDPAVGFLHTGDVVTVLQWGDSLTAIVYEVAGQPAECWVHTEYLEPILQLP